MGYDIKIESTNSIIEISFFGVLKHSDHLKARDELLEICHVHKIKNILVNAQNLIIDKEVTSLSIFDFGVTWAELARGAGIRIAAIPPKDITTKRNVQFGDNVAHNRGL
jgi:hypothetical protein